jgi:hypothetical protein
LLSERWRTQVSRFIKIVVTLEPREDGGLYAYSNDVPGFVLSHRNPEAVLADIKPALEGILAHLLKAPVVVEELGGLTETEPNRSVREYVTHYAAARAIGLGVLSATVMTCVAGVAVAVAAIRRAPLSARLRACQQS